ncbi:MAG: alpha/beta fold hydrolase, partial [Verrucomicrobia bacterium]|nr:alpha/beta fold hydrolase [Verrucomicrobiota bacterium]
ATDYVAPRNAREQELAEIWQAVLRRERVGVHDDFFALGGHSLLAVRLATEIDKLLGCKLPIAALFQSPTIESLARRLTDDNWAPAWRSLVPLQPQGGKPPLFFVHGWGGDVYGFLELAKLLPSDQPCYGIQAVGLDGRSARHTQVEEMAAYYIKEIVSFQPHGPIYLAGFSMGGIIAFEIARQLHRKGRRVAMLALIDTYPTGQIPWFFYGLLLIPRLQFHIRRWCQLPVREQLNYWQGRWKMFKVLLNRNRAKPSPITTVLEPAVEKPEIPGFHDYYHAIASAYQLRPYSGSADAFVSEKAKPEWRWYWRYLARGGVSFHPVTGDHMQVMFSPDHRAKLAHTLTAVLHQRQESEQARQANR